MSQGRSGYIDQWRGLSVLAVIIFHIDPAAFLLRAHVSRIWIALVEFCTVKLGPLGVDAFFVISGFLITRLLLQEETANGGISLQAFYLRRMTRILPAMLCYVVTVMVASAAGFTRLEPVEGVKAISYLCNTSVVACAYPFGQLWTLGVEEQFYLFWPLLLIVAGRFRVLLVSITLVLAAILGVMPSLVVRDHFNNGLAVYCLSSGVLFALSERFRAVFEAVTIPTWVLLIALIILTPIYWNGQWEFGYPLALLLVAPVLVAVTLGRSGNLFGPRLSECLRNLGLVSYSLYLWHWLAMWHERDYLSPTFRVLSVLAIPFAWVSYRYIELPCIAAGHRWSKAIVAARCAPQAVHAVR